MVQDERNPMLHEFTFGNMFKKRHISFIEEPLVLFSDSTLPSRSVSRPTAHIVQVDLPLATSLGGWAFEHCPKLTTLKLPKLTSVGRPEKKNGDGTLVPVFQGSKPRHDPAIWDRAYTIPDTPRNCHICRSVGVVWGVNVGIYGSPMECLGMRYPVSPGHPVVSCPVLRPSLHVRFVRRVASTLRDACPSRRGGRGGGSIHLPDPQGIRDGYASIDVCGSIGHGDSEIRYPMDPQTASEKKA